MAERIMIFIDGANVSKSAFKLGIKMDYLKLIGKLTDKRDNRRSYYFDAVKDTSQFNSKIGFLDALRRQGVTVQTKQLRTKKIRCKECVVGKALIKQSPALKFPDTNLIAEVSMDYQKGVDIALVTEFFRMAREDAFDTAIIVSGDNDFASAVECVKSMGKRVEIASFRIALGNDLKQIADRLIILDDFKENINKITIKDSSPKII